MFKRKRVNKSKEQIAAEMQHQQHIEDQKRLARLIFPVIEDMETVYDAQTVLNAISGYIKLDMEKKREALKLHDIVIDLDHEEESEIKTRMLRLVDLLQTESAKDLADLTEVMARKLPEYLMSQHIKGPMSQIKGEEFIA